MSVPTSVLVSVIDALADAVIIADDEGTIRLWNQAAQKLLGYTAQEQIGQKLSLLIPDRYKNAHDAGFQRFVKTGESRLVGVPVELMALHKSGGEICVELTVSRVQTEGVARMIGILRDNTLRHAREQESLAAEDRFSLLAEQTSDLITFTNADGLIDYVSPAVHVLLGYEVQEVLGWNYDRFFHQDDLPSLHLFLEQLTARDDVGRFINRIQHRDGHYLWFETTLKARRNSAGAIVRWLGIGRDITQQRQLTEQLNQAVRIAGLGHFELDIVHDTVNWSDTMFAIFGFTPGQRVTFEEICQVIHPDDQERFMKTREHSIRNGRSSETELRVVRPDGSIREVIYQVDAGVVHGRVLKVFGTVQDVTEKKEVERRLLQSEKLAVVGQLAAGIAHEIRNPMTVIKGFVQLLNERVSPEKIPYVEMILQELTRVDRVLSELLLLAKPQATQRARVSIDAVVGEVISFFSPEALKAKVQLIADLHCSGYVLADANQLKQVLINVLLNAVEAMPSGGRIWITCQVRVEHVLIEIRDEGTGIAQERLARLGEPFYTTKEKGTGLGLMVCRKILDLHEGNMTILSQLGKGTTVQIVLPSSAETE
ncbi:MAG: PAS domain S-box protein [Firmicutes bacterium]|nr:PAS domain S-box protein [Bacillota bacterium]